MHSIDTVAAADTQRKQDLHSASERRLTILAVIADVLAGAALATAGQRDPVTALTELLEADAPVIVELVEALDTADQAAALQRARNRARMRLDDARPDSAPSRVPMHWPIAFPEIFTGSNVSGFDAMIGNPPFLGGQRITGATGIDYRNHVIEWTAAGARGSADLVAYFFLMATRIAQSFGFLATNTIAQGDTSEVGLTQIIDTGRWCIHRAVPSTSWPGDTSLEIAKVWASSHPWNGDRLLDGRPVTAIDEMLYPVPASGWRKQRLAANADKSFQGSIVLGTGFVMRPEEAQALIDKDRRNADVLYPYLGGEDLNQSSMLEAPRWIINFHDWSKDKAQQYPDCWQIVEAKVKPMRQERKANGEFKRRKARAERYWIFAETSPKLYRTIKPLGRVLAMSLVSKPVLPVFVQNGHVLSHKTVVFAYDDFFHFGLLTSGFHYRWSIRHSSSLETRINYSPSDVFDTFPLPPYSEAVENAGERLDEHRSQLMTGRGMGLTSVYNLVHDPDVRNDDEIEHLRRLHVTLDVAVRDIYGWPDLDLSHGFHPVRGQGVRFTFSPHAAGEVLDRLLALNKQRYEAEVAAGLHDKKAKSPRTTKSVDADQGSLLGDAL